MSDPVKVIFPVEQDESGYPPVNEESIWCLPQERDVFQVDNIPFYAYDISLEDKIRADVQRGVLRFEKLLAPSKNTTIRVFAKDQSSEPLIVPSMQSFGGLTEAMEGSSLVAISFSPSADLAGALAFLDRESAAGR